MKLKTVFRNLEAGSRFKTPAGEFIKTQYELVTNSQSLLKIQHLGNCIALDSGELCWIATDQQVEVISDLFTFEDYEDGK